MECLETTAHTSQSAGRRFDPGGWLHLPRSSVLLERPLQCIATTSRSREAQRIHWGNPKSDWSNNSRPGFYIEDAERRLVDRRLDAAAAALDSVSGP